MPPKKKKHGCSKSKERKLKRKQEQEEIAASLAVVKAAYECCSDIMESLTAFKTYNRNSLDMSISFCRVSDMSAEDLKWTFQLMKESVKTYYENGGWGWNDKEKREELTHDSACFLLARESESRKLQGFLNFRFDLDEQIEVVYCYEVHLIKEVKRKGLGKFLIQILELIGHRTHMKKVVLTVFKDNKISNSFFREKLGYLDDETSPLFYDSAHPEDYSYYILSKALVKKHVVPSAGAAAAAEPVPEMECTNTAVAYKAIHDRSGRSSGKPGKMVAVKEDSIPTVETDVVGQQQQ